MNDLSKAPLFSIITITRNNKAGLGKTYRSLAAQTVKNYEWVVVDGASSDGSIDFLRENARDITRKTMISEPDQGIYDAMNKGIRLAKGDYVIFMNAGDVFADSGVLALLEPATEKAPDFIYGDAMEGNPPSVKPARRYKDLPWGMFTHHQAMIYRRNSIIDQKLKYSVLYEIAGDYDFTVRFLQKAKSIKYLPKPICIFEAGGVSQKNPALGRKEQYLIRENLQLVSLPKNVWIYAVQSLAWRLKAMSPSLYRAVKGFVLRISDSLVEKKAQKKII